MSVLSWIVLGLLAGGIASWIAGVEHGCLMTIILGVIGAVVGGAVFASLGGAGVTGCNFWSLGVAVVGALILIALGRAFGGSRR